MEIKTKPVYEIIDNFLSKEDHYRIKKDLENRNFEWYFSPKSGHPEEHEELYNWQYFHTMYYHQGGYKSRLFPIVQPLITKLKPMILIRIKVNATMYDKKIIKFKKGKILLNVNEWVYIPANTNHKAEYPEKSVTLSFGIYK